MLITDSEGLHCELNPLLMVLGGAEWPRFELLIMLLGLFGLDKLASTRAQLIV